VSLTERRAQFVYDAARLAAIAAQAPIIPVPWVDRESPFRTQFLEVIERQCGEHRSSSPEELHGSWMQAYLLMGWVYGEKYDRERKVHPDLVPYAKLGQLERDKDAVFVALCEIARLWIYDTALSQPAATGEGGDMTDRWMCGHCGTTWPSTNKNLGMDTSECPHRKCHRQMDEAIKFAHSQGFAAGVEAAAEYLSQWAGYMISLNTIANVRALAPVPSGPGEGHTVLGADGVVRKWYPGTDAPPGQSPTTLGMEQGKP
jgi:hypothetical protein